MMDFCLFFQGMSSEFAWSPEIPYTMHPLKKFPIEVYSNEPQKLQYQSCTINFSEVSDTLLWDCEHWVLGVQSHKDVEGIIEIALIYPYTRSSIQNYYLRKTIFFRIN